MVIAALEQKKVDTVFGYPGGAVLPLYDQLFHSRIRHILTRHEQGAVHAADGYARAGGRVGVVFATSGPGATNLVTGIANAYMDSVPLVIITGQVATRLLGTDSFQEADITGITLPITKHNYLIQEIAQLQALAEAFHIAGTGRCGPVLSIFPRIYLSRRAALTTRQVDIPGYSHHEGIGQITGPLKPSGRPKPVIFAGVGLSAPEPPGAAGPGGEGQIRQPSPDGPGSDSRHHPSSWACPGCRDGGGQLRPSQSDLIVAIG